MARERPDPIRMSKSGRRLAAGFGDQRLEAFQNRCKVVQTGAKWCNGEWAVSITGLVVIVVPAEDDTAVFSLAVNTDPCPDGGWEFEFGTHTGEVNKNGVRYR